MSLSPNPRLWSDGNVDNPVSTLNPVTATEIDPDDLVNPANLPQENLPAKSLEIATILFVSVVERMLLVIIPVNAFFDTACT